MLWLDWGFPTPLTNQEAPPMKRQDAERLFSEVHRLHQLGKNNTQIAHALQLRRATVVKWLGCKEYSESRGWKAGRSRIHTDTRVRERICQLKRDRLRDCYLVGSEYVQMDYCRKHPGEAVPPISYIKRVVRQEGLQSRKPKNKPRRGGSTYLLYPEESMRRLGYIQQ